MSIKNKLNHYLRKFGVELHGSNYLQALAKGDFKKNEFDFFKQVFKSKPIVIYDVGANRGDTIVKFLEHFPSSTIIAFEPVTYLCEGLRKLFHDNTNIKIENAGISDSTGELIFHLNKSIDTSSFLPSQKAGLNSDAQVQTIEQKKMPVKTLAQSYLEENIEQIHILKLDIQGSELKALKGAENLLKEKKIDIIYTEAYFIQQYVDQPLFPEIALYLSNFGYRLQDIYNPIYGKGKIAWCDAIFVNENL